ncbi:TSC22 domain family protein 4 isoform X2 [Pituophis catenifer annectens]|uniref:TSC22 domain family protein 4 isoform X2 n=1 Tax=Pituophis catenifer annectens TaxID=94852 RepID=UPI0039931231
MSVGKKKSGFQITSVTSDYEKEGLSGGDAKGPSEEPNPVENGSHHLNGGVGPKNGPSAPGSPGTAPLHPGSIGSVAGSRFRVVKLDHGLGEPYKRGRWTCRDFYEQEMDHHLVGRLADSARQPQSLDSRLEVAGLLAKPSSPFSPQMPRRGGPCLQSLLVLPVPAASAHQARSLGGGLPVLRPGRTPPSPASLHSTRVVAEKRPLAPEEGAQEPGDPPQPGTIPVVRVEEHLLPKSVTQLIPRETEERHKILPRETRSRPSSPAPLLFRDASPHRRTSDPFGVARFNLARSVFGMGTSHDSDDDRELEAGGEAGAMSLDRRRTSVRSLVTAYESRWEHPGCGCCLLPDPGASPRPRQRGCTSPASSREASPARVTKPKETPPNPRKLNSCRQKEADQRLLSLLLVLHSGTNSSMIAIDNKIEQAMDLVKSHLMFAVREEVEVLREQIKDLSERNAALEQENSLLRSLANTEQTSQFQAQLHENKPSSSGSA